MTRGMASLLYALVAALVLLLLGFCCAAGHMRQALLVYLASWLFVLGLMLGSMGLLMIHALTGGEWGTRLAQPWLAATRLLPYVAVGVLPLLAGMHVLFPWAGAAPPNDPYLDHQRWYLNAPGLIVRTVVLFAIWAWMALVANRSTGSGLAFKPHLAAVGLIVLLVTATLTAVDWVMSLVPRWHSTDIGLLWFTSQLLAAFALAVLAREARTDAGPPRLWRDFGNLMLVMVLGWAYVAFIDYLTSWVADLPAETAWYLPRLHTDWWWLGVTVAVLGLGVPFFMLLSGKAKSSARALCTIAASSLFTQWLYALWLVWPSGITHGFALHWSDPLICIGLLGSYSLLYLGHLRKLGDLR